MCHDGARALVRPTLKHSEKGKQVAHAQKVALRAMIRRFISSGFNVALINGLEVRDTKVRQPIPDPWQYACLRI